MAIVTFKCVLDHVIEQYVAVIISINYKYYEYNFDFLNIKKTQKF